MAGAGLSASNTKNEARDRLMSYGSQSISNQLDECWRAERCNREPGIDPRKVLDFRLRGGSQRHARYCSCARIRE